MDGSHVEALAKTLIPRATREADTMADDHWFDTLNKELVREIPRRTLLGAAAAVVAGFAFGVAPGIEAAKNRKKKGKRKGKGKGKGKGKHKGRPKRCGQAVQISCEIAFFTPEDIKFCKDKCERCEAAGTEFCIHGPDDEHPVDHATCCPFGEECCVAECCPPDRCCEVDGFRRCLDPGESCCPSDFGGYCQEGSTCCPGKGCQACDAPYVLNVATCECECLGGDCDGCDELCVGPALACCDGACVDVRKFDNAHCGSCLPCATGEECCYGVCLDPQQITCCRDRPGPYWRTCPVPEVCSEQPCTPNGGIYCCPP